MPEFELAADVSGGMGCVHKLLSLLAYSDPCSHVLSACFPHTCLLARVTVFVWVRMHLWGGGQWTLLLLRNSLHAL